MTESPEFQAVDLQHATPPGVCPECARSGVEHTETGLQVARCEHSDSAAWRVGNGPWRIQAGISARQLIETVLTALLRAPMKVLAYRDSVRH